MADHDHNCGLGVSIAFLSGAMLGAMAAILYAPHSGEETRRAIKGYARRTEEDMLEKAKEIRTDIAHTMDEAKRYLKETEATIAAALAAGLDLPLVVPPHPVVTPYLLALMPDRLELRELGPGCDPKASESERTIG